MATEEKVIGLIAGDGRLPFMVAKGAKNVGLKVICAGLAGYAESRLADEVDEFYIVEIARPGSWLRKLKKNGVTKAIMVGGIARREIYSRRRILRYLPDWRALRVWYWRLRHKDKQPDMILGALAEELASGGIILEDTTMYCKEHIAKTGTMTKAQPSPSVQDDVEFGWSIAKKLGELDIGQSVAVKEKAVLSVEGIEGTAEMIERTGKLCKNGSWTLIKVAKPNQDIRFDMPCIGPDTIKSLAANGGKCVVVEAGKTIIIDKPETLNLANELGIAIVGR
jgi:DUF1009 family protein